MKTIERSEFRAEDGTISIDRRLRGTLKFGLRWYAEMQAQAFVTDRLGKSLGADYVLIRNLAIPGTFHVLPLILIGPQGVRVLYASPARGVFRAKGDEWMVFDGGARHFRRRRPNLQTDVVANAKLIQDLLQERGYPLPEVEAVLIFANPRTHVDTARPRVRVVLADAIENFASNLLQFPPIMNQGDVDLLVESLTAAPAVPEPPPAPEAIPSVRSAPIRPAAPLGMPAPPRRGRFRLSRTQWILLGGLLLVQGLVVAVFAFLILNNAFPS